MADYPDWVMKFKKKGTYINRVKDRYYLYAAHSERVPGTKKIKRICDGYLGRITEEEGLISSKDKVSGAVTVYEYGLSALLLFTCSSIHKGFRKTFTKNGDFVMIAAILTYMYGRYDDFLFQHSYLSILFSELDFKTPPTEAQAAGIERGSRMIKDTVCHTFGDDLPDVLTHFGYLYKVKVNEKLYLSWQSDEIKHFKQKYKMNLEE